MPLPKENLYTIDYIYSLPDGKRAELIDGVLYDMAPPLRIHQRIIHKMERCLGDYIDRNGGACEVYPAPFAVFIAKDDKNYVEPDISVICDKNKLSDRGCEGAPDLIIEVVSPSSRRMDYSTKNTLYSENGVREYWIIDPQKERVTAYHYEEDSAPSVYPFDWKIPVGIYPGFTINIANLLK